MYPEFPSQVYEAFSKLARRLRALDLPYGLTNERLGALATVGANEPISLSALAEAESISLPTISRMVAKLEAEGLVKRREQKYGDREILVSTTAKGRRAYQRTTQQSLTHLQGTLSTLKPEQLAAIHTLLSSLAGPQLSERTSEVQRLYAIAPVGLCYFDTDLRFLYINEWLARINGLSVEANLGKPSRRCLKTLRLVSCRNSATCSARGSQSSTERSKRRHRLIQESRDTTCTTTIRTRARTARSWV